MKPSDRIKQIMRALKILDGQDESSPHFDSLTFVEHAIMNYLDELELGTTLNQRRTKEPHNYEKP